MTLTWGHFIIMPAASVFLFFPFLLVCFASIHCLCSFSHYLFSFSLPCVLSFVFLPSLLLFVKKGGKSLLESVDLLCYLHIYRDEFSRRQLHRLKTAIQQWLREALNAAHKSPPRSSTMSAPVRISQESVLFLNSRGFLLLFFLTACAQLLRLSN